jgi:hypothetical protein
MQMLGEEVFLLLREPQSSLAILFVLSSIQFSQELWGFPMDLISLSKAIITFLFARNMIPKTTGVTIKDTGMENCLGKAKFTSAEECMRTAARGAGNRSSFYS